MIKLEKTDVYGWEAAIRGMRNPMNSWKKSDSFMCKESDKKCVFGCRFSDDLSTCPVYDNNDYFVIGRNDFKLMMSLAKAGPDHRKFMRFITVTVDITAPLYWWKEFDTYKVGTVANSCSTMHKIAEKEFTPDDFSHEHLISDEPVPYSAISPKQFLMDLIKTLNGCREMYLNTNDKKWWWQMIQLLPTSYNQKRTVHLNYEVLKNIYFARKSHKLDEWHDFCHWIEKLPYSELITGEVELAEQT